MGLPLILKTLNEKLNITDHTWEKLEGAPEALPADGGDADTVTGHTVQTDVPENAVFTDTLYTHPGEGTNPHGTTKADLQLEKVNNWPASSAVDDASATTYATTLGVKRAYDMAAKGDTIYVPSATLQASLGDIMIEDNGTMQHAFYVVKRNGYIRICCSVVNEFGASLDIKFSVNDVQGTARKHFAYTDYLNGNSDTSVKLFKETVEWEMPVALDEVICVEAGERLVFTVEAVCMNCGVRDLKIYYDEV